MIFVAESGLKILTKSQIDEFSEIFKELAKEMIKEMRDLTEKQIEKQIEFIKLQQDDINSLNDRLESVETLFFNILVNEITPEQKIKLMQYGIKEFTENGLD